MLIGAYVISTKKAHTASVPHPSGGKEIKGKWFSFGQCTQCLKMWDECVFMICVWISGYQWWELLTLYNCLHITCVYMYPKSMSDNTAFSSPPPPYPLFQSSLSLPLSLPPTLSPYLSPIFSFLCLQTISKSKKAKVSQWSLCITDPLHQTSCPVVSTLCILRPLHVIHAMCTCTVYVLI